MTSSFVSLIRSFRSIHKRQERGFVHPKPTYECGLASPTPNLNSLHKNNNQRCLCDFTGYVKWAVFHLIEPMSILWFHCVPPLLDSFNFAEPMGTWLLCCVHKLGAGCHACTDPSTWFLLSGCHFYVYMLAT